MARLIDTTLREGEQTPGLHFSLAAKKRIYAGLARTGVDEIEIGVASLANADLPALANYAGSHFRHQPFSIWCRCKEEEIRLAARLQPSVLNLSIPASDLHLAKKFGRERPWALSTARAAIGQALALGIGKVALGLEDASRADHGFLRALGAVAEEAGAFRLRLADTVGLADPALITTLVELMRPTPLEVAVHCHNDFGMATANTIQAFGAGAQWGDVTLLGLGERAGNSRIEEVMAYLILQKGEKNYNLANLLNLCRQLAAETGRQIPSHQPLLGSAIFSCQSGIHQHALLADPTTYEPYAPELVGTKRTLLMAAGSGRHGLAAALHRLQLPRPNDGDLHHLWQRMRQKAALLRRPLHDREIYQLALEGATISNDPGSNGPLSDPA
ncbi:MAG: pyruvate carboxyltransferase [Desulfurivibrionaceae bacterium]|nr:pyruvate carboxyltransferase [Desulfurivibrionaceae bacterium]